ncbi:MAG: Ferredoxin [Nitrosopumilus sp.]|nr:Ferredoxin [Nitrosopumilus sp.]
MNTYQALKILNMDSDATQDEIKSSYRKLALELHPDKNGKKDSEFKKITEAYNILKKTKSKNVTKNQIHSQNIKNNFKRKPEWGAPDDGNVPQQDWGKYTQTMEKENPSFWEEYEKQFWEDYNSKMNVSEKDEEYERKSPKEAEIFVNVDKSKCIGCCSCETIAPNVFEINKQKMSNPKSSVINQKGASRNKIMNAAETCPTKAIRIEDLESKESIFP